MCYEQYWEPGQASLKQREAITDEDHGNGAGKDH